MIGRVSGYSGFDSYAVVGISSLKPGQVSLKRDYYKDANKNKADGKTYLGTFSRFASNHQNTINAAVKPSDYKPADRTGKQNTKYEFLHNPDLYNHTKIGRRENQLLANRKLDPRAKTELKRIASTNIAGTFMGTAFNNTQQKSDTLYKTTQHWKSNYAGENEKTQSRPKSQAQRPFWSYPKREHVARRTFFKTEYHNTLGNYGHNPRTILNAESTKLENEANELTMGSTKVTQHIPGYGGFIARTDLNEKALEHSKSNAARELMRNKINLNENFNVKIPGYSGYKPMSCFNDRGQVRPNLFSTQGETFF